MQWLSRTDYGACKRMVSGLATGGPCLQPRPLVALPSPLDQQAQPGSVPHALLVQDVTADVAYPAGR